MYDRDALLAAVDLRDLADDLLGPSRTHGRGRMWRCPNTNHAQTGRTPPVSIFTSRRGEQRWRCHGCGEGGTAIDLVLATNGGTTRDALRYLAERVGRREPWDASRSTARPARATSLPPARCLDPEGLDRYVQECAERLWTPAGETTRRWLTDVRALPAEVLVKNLVGADVGPRRQARPDGMPHAAGVVLPVIERGRAVYAQVRVPHPRPDGPRYFNPTSELAPNPRFARIRPVETAHAEVVVTEGAIDALTAAGAGYRSVAVLSAAYTDEALAVALARLPRQLVIAFDADEAGRAGAARLAALLGAHQHPAGVIDLGVGDLNDASRGGSDWSDWLLAEVAAGRGDQARNSTLSR